jgi:cell division inhibitor SepF
MAGALRKTMIYLGLAEEDDRYDRYEGFDDEPDSALPEHDGDSPLETRTDSRPESRHAPVTHISRSQVARMVTPVPAPGPDIRRITTIHPRTYNEAKTIGESFRTGTPVIMNLTEMDDSDAKRLVDFAAGLVFGLHGSIERVTSKVFLLSPANVEVATPEKVRVPERGFFNQS